MAKVEEKLALLRAAYERGRIPKDLYERNVLTLGGVPHQDELSGMPRPPQDETRPRRRWIVPVVAAIVVASSLAGVVVYYLSSGLIIGPGGGTVHNALLLYDPTGGNYAPSTRGGSGTGFGFLVEDVQGQPSVRKVAVAGDEPIAAVGDGQLARTADGGWTVSSFTAKAAEAASQADLAANPLPFEFKNIEVDLNAIGVVYGNRTFALGLGPTQDFVFVSTQRKPLFFTNVHVKGVVLKPTFMDSIQVFDFDVMQDFQRFRTQTGMAVHTEAPGFVLADTVEYLGARLLEGDVHDVVLPEEIATLGLQLLGQDLNTNGSRFLLNLTRNVDEVLVTLGETHNTLQNMDHWFVLGTRNLTYGEMKGIVRLNVSESDFSAVRAHLGIDFQAPPDLPLRIHIGVTADSDPQSSSYVRKEVRDLWTVLQDPHADPPVAAVNVSAFALVLDYRNVAEYLGDALTLPAGVMEKLRAVATFRNPAVALLFDRNFTDSLGSPTQPLWSYAAVAFLRDFPSSDDILYYLTLEGELYDSWMFLGVSPSGLSSIPVLVADAQGNATEGVVTGTLPQIYGNPTAASTLVVDTEGFALGTTVKTVLNYTQFRNFVKYLPVDVGAYDVHDKVPGTFYHVPVLYPAWGTGPTYLGTHVSVKALFVRGEPQRNRLASFLTQFLGGDAPGTAFAALVGNVTLDTPFLKMLDGYFLAFSVRPSPVPTNLTLSSLTATDLLYDGSGGIDVDASAVVSRRGGWLDFDAIVVRFVVTSPSGRLFSGETRWITGGLLDISLPPIPPIHTDSPEAGVYRVDASLMKLEEFGTEIDAKSTTFRMSILGPPDHLDVSHTDGASQEAGASFSVTVRVVDAQGHVVTGYAGTVTFSSSDASATLPSPHSYSPILDQGVRTFSITLRRAGDQVVTVTATGVAQPSFTFTVRVVPNTNPLIWMIQKVSGDGQSAPRGTTLPQPFVVRVTDGFGNILSGVQVDWTIAFDPYPLSPGSLSATSTTTDAAGQASSTLTLGNGITPFLDYAVRAWITANPLLFVLFTATPT